MKINKKQCGCFGAGHSSRCQHYAEDERAFVARFVTTQYGKTIWNAALDDAAARCDEVLECVAAARIRELKK